MVLPWCGSLNDRGRRTDATERAQRREDRVRAAAGGGGQESGRSLPRDGRLGASVLQLEAALRWAGAERAPRVAAVARREPQTKDAGGRSDLGQTYSPGCA